MTAGIVAIASLTMNRTMEPNGILMSVTTTSVFTVAMMILFRSRGVFVDVRSLHNYRQHLEHLYR
jgi:hypothetical protein